MGDVAALLQQQLPADLGQQGHNPAIIQEAIDRLDAFQVKARSWLFKALAAQSQGASPQQLADVLGQLCDNAGYLLPDTPEAQLAPHVQHFRDITAQLAALELQLAQQEQAAGVQAQVAEFENFLLNGQYGEAAWAAIRMRETLKAELEQGQEAQEQEQGQRQGQHQLGAQALEELSSSYERCEARMKQVLAEEAASVLRVDAGRRQLVLRSTLPVGSPPAPVAELWAALQARGQLQQQLDAMAEEVLRGVVEPMLLGGFVVSALAAPEGQACLQWSQALPGQEYEPEGCCLKILKLLAEQLFNWDEVLLRKWGDAYWRSMSDAYVRLHATAYVRNHADDSAACSAKVEAARGLEEFAESLGIVEEPYLGPAVEALSRQVLCARQQRYLEKARDLILGATGRQEPVLVGLPLAVDQQYCSRLVSGQLQEWEVTDPPCGCSSEAVVPLARGQYGVSAHMPELLRLIDKAMEDAVASGEPTTAEALVGAVSKIALMQRILPNRDQLQQVLQLALLHFNDLHHLADALLLLPACVSPDLEALLAMQQQEGDGSGAAGGRLSFLEDVLLLRKAAEEVMRQQISLQHQALGELLEGLGRLRRIGSGASSSQAQAQAGLAARKSINQLLHSLGRMGRVAVPVLAPEPLVRLVSALLGGVCGSMVEAVLAKRDIGIDDCKELRDVLHPLAHEALPAFLGTATAPGKEGKEGKSSISGVPLEVVSAAVRSQCAPLRKLQSLLVLLDAGIKEFVAGWTEGQLVQDGWQGPELEHLLLALFQDSDYRRQALAKIREGPDKA